MAERLFSERVKGRASTANNVRRVFYPESEAFLKKEIYNKSPVKEDPLCFIKKQGTTSVVLFLKKPTSKKVSDMY
jgi:predicted Ser/Thr protein kinase